MTTTPFVILLVGLITIASAAVSVTVSCEGDTTTNCFSSSGYVVNGVKNADIICTLGETITFTLDIAGHPFNFKEVAGSGTSNLFDATFTSGEQGLETGTVEFVCDAAFQAAVEANDPANLYYNCEFHNSMSGRICLDQCQECGDGETTGSEDCDDEGVATALCNEDCTFSLCGDGIVNEAAGEECDDSGASDSCDEECNIIAVCGNGELEGDEECDDGELETELCNFDCTLAFCGDGYTNEVAGEECDEFGDDTSICNMDCTLSVCGDGYTNIESGEECDDGGALILCTVNCELVILSECGDFFVGIDEDCDDGGESETCNDDCTFAACGDGKINSASGEDCDDSGESETCNDDCTASVCGDGMTNVASGEECDDSGESENCDNDCTFSECGDFNTNLEAGEQCDTGIATLLCTDECTISYCGDGIVNDAAGEECDDILEFAQGKCSVGFCKDTSAASSLSFISSFLFVAIVMVFMA